MKLKRLFTAGVMDKDTSPSFMENGKYRHAENLRFHTNNGQDYEGENIKGTLEVSDVTEGNTDLKCIGAKFNEDKDVIYYKLASTNGQISIDAEYNIDTDTTTIVLKDTRGVLKYNKNGFITGWNEINGLQIWSEWGNNIRRINTERAKTYGINNFEEEDITLMVKPPFQKPTITLQDTTTTSEEENNIEEKFLHFSYRYRYLDGEYSTLAPFSEVAFKPETFEYDFATQVNKSMINKFNEVEITFNIGDEKVTEVQLVFVEAGSLKLNVIDDFNKEKLGWTTHNIDKTFKFNNNKVYRVLSENILLNYFHNIPYTNQAQEMIEGRLLIANYLENFNIKDDLGNPIEIDYSIELDAQEIVLNTPEESAKSIRDYEFGLAYQEEYLRSSTILNSKENTIYVPIANSITKNSFIVNLKNKPPVKAKYFRFFVKQNKKGYETILPTLFYADGVYRWIKLEGADKDKVKKGDYLYVKADSQGVLDTLQKVKVLDVKEQNINFLQPPSVTDEDIKEKSGLYFKIKPDGLFRLDPDDFQNINLETYNSSRNEYQYPLINLTPYVDAPEMHFYGTGLQDCGVSSYNGLNVAQRRYTIEIDSTGAQDTFRWGLDNGASWEQTLVPIVSGSFGHSLQVGGINSINITFENQTGHTLNDRWTCNMRDTWSIEGRSKSYGFFRFYGDYNETLILKTYTAYELLKDKLYKIESLGDTDFTLIGSSVNAVGAYFWATGSGIGTGTASRLNYENEEIRSGAQITLEYDEYGEGSTYFKIENISGSSYDNIEEWFHEEDIISEIISQVPTFDTSKIHFVRGILFKYGEATQIQQLDKGFMTMVIQSQATQNNSLDGVVKTRTNSTLFQSKKGNFLLFETEPKEQPEEIYHEIGKTYKIENGFHLADLTIPGDQNQTAVQDLRVKLDFFNVFSYGNSVESYKIKDDFNAKSMVNGIKVLSPIANEYKEVHRVVNVAWSDIYEDDFSFNGLNDFNPVLRNNIKLDKENSSIQKLHNSNGNLMVLQEDAIGILPYNKNIIYDADGGSSVGISTNILDKRSYRPYASGIYGISKSPESFVSRGNRNYFADERRGAVIRLSTDGVTEINDLSDAK